MARTEGGKQMTCIRIASLAIACVNPWGRVKIGNRYVWIDYHSYCGPTFYWDMAMSNEYLPKSSRDPIWNEFGKWLEKYEARKEKARSIKKVERR
jgi:hypothetical protein